MVTVPVVASVPGPAMSAPLQDTGPDKVSVSPDAIATVPPCSSSDPPMVTLVPPTANEPALTTISPVPLVLTLPPNDPPASRFNTPATATLPLALSVVAACICSADDAATDSVPVLIRVA